MTVAAELIHKVQHAGGRIRVDDRRLFVSPKTVSATFREELRQHKPAIIALLETSILSGPPPADPEAWRQAFIWWLDSDCTLRPRAFGGVNALHRAFCEWEIARDEVPCDRGTFIRLLEELGFFMGEIGETTLVWGLMLRSDSQALG
jgi:hypothetical protein